MRFLAALVGILAVAILVALRLRRHVDPPAAPAGSWEPADAAVG